MSDHDAVLLYDGECGLCDRSVRTVLDKDPAGRFAFAALQSEAAQRLLEEHGVSRDALPDSVVLVDDAGVHTLSTAAVRAGKLLGGRFALAARIGGVLPRPIRDALYALVAKHRHRFFARPTACIMPTPELRSRFLDLAERK